MGILSGIHPIVRFRNGELWHFYSTRDQGIFFRRLGGNGVWEEPIELLRNTQDDFSVRIDSQDHLHLICRSDKGEILYLYYNGKVWSRQVLSSYDPARYVIRYPIILPIKNQIHVLFAIGTSFNTGFWSLYHYYWDEKAWHSAEITRFTAGYRLSPFTIDLSEKHIHLVYRGLATNTYQIFHCRYYLEHGIWSTPENVTHSTTDCNMPSILIRNDKLHLIWTSLIKNDLTVKYKSKAIRIQNKAEWSRETDLSKPGSNTAFPHLIWVEDKLWCVWCQTDNLYGCHSEDDGMTWNEPEKINSNGIGSFHHIHYSTNHVREKEIFQFQWILGNVEERFFLPVAGEYMEPPKYAAGPPLSDWEPGADFLSKKGQRNGFFPEMQNKSAGKARTYETGWPVQPVAPEEFTGDAIPEESRFDPQPSLEKALLREFDKQEEYNDTILGKLEEQSRLDDIILEETREIISLLKENTEKLQNLMQDMEQIKKDLKLLQSKRLFDRLFRNGS